MTQSRAKATRRSIIQAAATVFEQHGFAGASITKILEAAHTTKGALYFHFVSKEALAQEILSHHPEWLTRDLETTPMPLQNLIELSYRFALALDCGPITRASMRLALEEGCYLNPHEATEDSWVAMAHEICEKARASDNFRPGLSPDKVAFTTTSTITGLTIFSNATANRQDLRHRIEDYWDLILPGLAHDDVLDSLQTSCPEYLTSVDAFNDKMPDAHIAELATA